MPFHLTDGGTDNQLRVPSDGQDRLNGKITLAGSGNRIAFASGSRSTGHFNLQCGDRNAVTVGRSTLLGGLMIYVARDATVAIGNKVSFNGKSRLLLHEQGEIRIGDRCLFASDVVITVSDMHSVLDAETGKRINPARNVLIEDHVWVGLGALVLKGVTIGTGSVVAAGAVVTKDVPAGCIVAGNPARVVRTKVNWTTELV